MGGRAGWLGLTMTMTKSNTTNTITSVTMRKLKAAANSDSPSPEESSPSSQAPPPPLPLPPALPLPLPLSPPLPLPPPPPLPLQTPTLPAVVQPTSATPPQSSSVVKQASSSWWSSSTNVSGVVAAGVVAGVGLLILLFLVMLLVACCRRKNNHNNKRKKPNPHHHSYAHANYAQYHDHAHAHTKVQNNHKSNTHNVPSHVATGSSAASQMPYTYTTPTRPVATLGLTNNSFTYEELERATQGFSKANILGQGGFGLVHKGVLSNGKEVAVKSLKMGSGQGENEFQAEVGIISRVHHRHLVSLVGYCTAGEQRILVYEFVPNKTLEFHLHGKNQPAMDFPSRLKIALGSAKGIAYLHEDCNPRIFHRDIKAANILLEHDFEAKVADFGLAKMSNDKNTHVSTRVMGTFGYLAPEYAASGKLTEKSDVFSFGVVLLELITGRHPINPIGHKDSLVDWARPKLGRVVDEGVFDGVVDPRLGSNFNPQEMAKLVACAAASIRHSAKKRPKMSQIVRTLEGDMSLESLNEGVKPGESMHLGGESSSCEYNTSLYRRDLQYFRRALESENNSSSE